MRGLLFIGEPAAADFVGADDVEPEGASDLRDLRRKMLVEAEAHYRRGGLVNG
jgi:hypothetical protein